MKIINFFLFMGCILFFNLTILGLLIVSPSLFIFSLALFCFMYYSFKMDTKEKVQRIELTYRNGDNVVEVSNEEDDFPYFNRDDFKFNN